ncbi:hypothetical protein Tco_0410023 [Tanacetum coccineum]
MDDPNITMEEYIRLEEEKARKRGKVFNWETAKYGKIWYDEDIHDLRSVETEFPAIAFNDEVSSETLSCEPTVSSLNNEIDFRISFDDSDDEDYTVIFEKNSFSYKIISTNDLKTDSENDNEKVMPSLPSPEPTINMALPPRDQRHQYLRYEGLQYTEADIADFELRLARIYKRDVHRDARGRVLQYVGEAVTNLDTARALQFQLGGARSIAGRSQAPEKLIDLFYLRRMAVNVPYLLARYLRLFATRRKSEAHISGGQFVARLAEHFGLLTAEILQGLTVIAPALSVIDMAELVRLQICEQLDDTWAWVAMGPERQPDAVAPPPPAAARTMPQRMDRLEEDVHETRGMLAEQREVISAMAGDFSRFCTWTTTSLAWMMDRAGVKYTSYFQTPREYQRRVRCKTGEASTSTAQQDPQQLDP